MKKMFLLCMFFLFKSTVGGVDEAAVQQEEAPADVIDSAFVDEMAQDLFKKMDSFLREGLAWYHPGFTKWSWFISPADWYSVSALRVVNVPINSAASFIAYFFGVLSYQDLGNNIAAFHHEINHIRFKHHNVFFTFDPGIMSKIPFLGNKIYQKARQEALNKARITQEWQADDETPHRESFLHGSKQYFRDLYLKGLPSGLIHPTHKARAESFDERLKKLAYAKLLHEQGLYHESIPRIEGTSPAKAARVLGIDPDHYPSHAKDVLPNTKVFITFGNKDDQQEIPMRMVLRSNFLREQLEDSKDRLLVDVSKLVPCNEPFKEHIKKIFFSAWKSIADPVKASIEDKLDSIRAQMTHLSRKEIFELAALNSVFNVSRFAAILMHLLQASLSTVDKKATNKEVLDWIAQMQKHVEEYSCIELLGAENLKKLFMYNEKIGEIVRGIEKNAALEARKFLSHNYDMSSICNASHNLNIFYTGDYLDVSHMKLRDIQDIACLVRFKSDPDPLKVVKHINASHNAIAAIQNNAFGRLPSLQSLDLSHNKISQIQKNGFHGLKELEEIDLEGNKLERLPFDVFDSMHNLKFINLSNNPIFFMNPFMFKKLPQLKKIMLRGTKLSKERERKLREVLPGVEIIL